MTSDVKIEIKNLYKVFGNNPVAMMELVKTGTSKQELLDEYNHVLGLKNINFEISDRHIQVIMGLSGSGKSTLIRHINRLIEPTAGNVIVDGQDVLAMTRLELQEFRRSQASMVFQRFALMPHRSVADNVAYGLHIQGIKGEEAEKRSQRWIERVGLAGYESHYTSQLSGGMQQRVGLARALATDAEILLMDEPFSALDPLIRTDMQEILLGLQTELQKTIIFITHDLDEALRLGNSIVILRDGEVIQIGTAQQIVMNPVDNYIKDFIKDINRGRVIQVSSIMNTTISNTGPQIDGDTVLEDALQVISNSGSGVGEVTKDGKVVGSVDVDTIISTLSRRI
ncbi:MAG: glycine/betaine ABC transporter [Alphaproteobacteria bacterium]|nr:glycine/betaine ABC transporter [Alphaproteobacteria bacterium]|tara:strand:+ start:4629 stop:5648 length:1020 start_codon:yes stop_codon:yes gene_type:complete